MKSLEMFVTQTFPFMFFHKEVVISEYDNSKELLID